MAFVSSFNKEKMVKARGGRKRAPEGRKVKQQRIRFATLKCCFLTGEACKGRAGKGGRSLLQSKADKKMRLK